MVGTNSLSLLVDLFNINYVALYLVVGTNSLSLLVDLFNINYVALYIGSMSLAVQKRQC